MRLCRKYSNARRGLTLVEVMIACAIMGIVFLAAAFIQSSALKQIRALYGDARTLHRAHLVMERIRYQLAMATVASSEIVDSGSGINYVNPNNPAGQISGFRLEDGKVMFYEDIGSNNASTPGQGIGPVKDIAFEIVDAGNAIRVRVQTEQKYQWRLLGRPYTLMADVVCRN